MSTGLIPAGEGSDRLTVDRLALIERWTETFGVDLDSDIQVALAQQEAGHVAGLVEAAVEAAEKECNAERDVLDGAMHSVWLHGDWRWLTRNMTTEEREAAADAVERHWAVMQSPAPIVTSDALQHLRWWRS